MNVQPQLNQANNACSKPNSNCSRANPARLV